MSETGVRWQRLVEGQAGACGSCGVAAAVVVEGQPRCWPCLAEGLARDLGVLRRERQRLYGLVEAHEGVLRVLNDAVAQVQQARRGADLGPGAEAPAWLVQPR